MAHVVYELIKGVPFVTAKLYGRGRSFNGRFVVDTGAALTIVRTSRIDALGFGAKDAIQFFSTESVIGKERGYRLLLPRVNVFNETVENVEVAAMDLPPKYNIDGLIGMNFSIYSSFVLYPPSTLFARSACKQRDMDRTLTRGEMKITYPDEWDAPAICRSCL